MKEVILIVFLFHAAILVRSSRPLSDCGDRIVSDGYPMERHIVITDDNYILTMQRIPYSPNLNNADVRRPVVFLIHGMLSSSADWILMGPDIALGYMLSDAGFDVWMGNTYSKKHKYWPTYWQIFWNFSWHKIGTYDVVPNMIDYILDLTGAKQLQYIGHSQGTTAYLVMMSEKKENNDKIKSAHLLGPAAYMGNMKSPLTRIFAPYLGMPNAMVEVFGSTEFKPSNEIEQELGIAACKATSPYVELCANEIFLIGGYDTEQLDRELMEHIKATSPAGASINQNFHYCQEHNSKKFRKFDYGPIRNQWEYNGAFVAPNYKLENVKSPVMLYYGANDWMCDIEEMRKLRDQLPNVKLDYLVSFAKWSHLDFIWGKKARKYVYDKVLEQMKLYEQ